MTTTTAAPLATEHEINGQRSRAGEDPQHITTWNIRTVWNRNTAYNALIAKLTSEGRLAENGFPLSQIDLKYKQAGTWQATCTYSIKKLPEESTEYEDFQFEGSTTGGTTHITTSLETVDTFKPTGKIAPNFKQAINVRQDGDRLDVQGTDRIVRIMRESITGYMTYADWFANQLAYRNSLHTLTGSVNNASFNGVAAGECLFEGADWRSHGNDLVQITYHFAYSPNITSDEIGDITGINRDGWDYPWILFEDAQDTNGSSKLVRVPIAVYIERIYPRADFGALDLLSTVETVPTTTTTTGAP